MSIGPIQLIALSFDEFEPKGEILRELDALMQDGAIRLIDAQFVRKDNAGRISSMEMSGLSPAEQIEFGAVIGALLGGGAAGEEGAEAGALGGALAAAEGSYGLTPGDVQEIAEQVPPGGAAALMMIEHTWATRFRDVVAEAGGVMVAQGFLTPQTLFLIGAELEAQAEALATIELAAEIETEALLEAEEALVLSEAIQEEATRRAVEALIVADMIEEAAIEEAMEVVAAAQLVEKTAGKDEIEALYVQTAHSIVTENGKLVLQGLAPNTLYFSDRPQRVVGHVTSEEFLRSWSEGEDSFAEDPPNAALSVIGGDGEVREVVVVLRDPSLEGNVMTYNVEVLDGEMPAIAGPTALFIDTVGRPASPGSVAGVRRRKRRRRR